MARADAERGAEGGMPSAAAIEAEDKLIEVGLKVLAAQAVIDALLRMRDSPFQIRSSGAQ